MPPTVRHQKARGQTPEEAFSHGETEARSMGTGPVTGEVFSRRGAEAAECQDPERPLGP